MRIFWRVLVALVLVAALLGIGVYAYNAGIAQGLLQNGQVQPAAPGHLPYPAYGYPFPFFGFGFLGCLIPLFLLFLFFGSMRALFWHGPMGWGGWGRMHHHRHWDWRDEQGKGVPPFFEEWHRRAHTPENDSEKKD